VSAGPREAGEAIAAAAGELTRIWRAARAQARPGVFPGASDGLVERFVGGLGEALVHGRPAEEAWARLDGVVRLDPAAEGEAEEELRAEWRILGEVLAAACDALRASPEVVDAAARAVEAARHGLERIRTEAPPGVLRLAWRSPFRRRSAGPR
jgi:hypothetical protein